MNTFQKGLWKFINAFLHLKQCSTTVFLNPESFLLILTHKFPIWISPFKHCDFWCDFSFLLQFSFLLSFKSSWIYIDFLWHLPSIFLATKNYYFFIWALSNHTSPIQQSIYARLPCISVLNSVALWPQLVNNLYKFLKLWHFTFKDLTNALIFTSIFYAHSLQSSHLLSRPYLFFLFAS